MGPGSRSLGSLVRDDVNSSNSRFHFQTAKTQGVLRRHCEPTGGANARPMTGSAKQSITGAAYRRGIASSLPLLAMTAVVMIQVRVPPPPCPPALHARM